MASGQFITASVETSHAWAVPVRPDLLGERIEAFTKALPKLHALRLCHRFGQGPDVYITKLPIELEQAVEELIVRSVKADEGWWHLDEWQGQFRCFESRCAPVDHLIDAYSPLDDAVEDFEPCDSCGFDYMFADHCGNVCTPETTQKCATCQHSFKPRMPWRCENSCHYKRELEMHELAWDWNWHDTHITTKDHWVARVDQKSGGKFENHAKTLRQHFGLEVTFTHTRLADGERDAWPKHRHQHWNADELQTTICFLTLPGQAQRERVYSATDMEVDIAAVDIQAMQANAIQLPSVEIQIAARARSHRAMKILALKPWMHPSQPGLGMADAGESTGVSNDTRTMIKRYGKKSDWPKFVNTVKSRYQW